MGNKSIEVLIVWSLNTKISSADIIDGFVVNHERAVRVFESRVCGEDRVVWLHDGGSDLWCRVHAEFEFALFAVVHRQSLHEQSTKPRTGTTAEGVENEEALQPRAVVRNSSQLVKDLIDKLLAYSVVTSCVVVGCIFFTGDHLIWVEETSVWPSSDFVDNIRFEIAVDGSWDIFAIA